MDNEMVAEAATDLTGTGGEGDTGSTDTGSFGDQVQDNSANLDAATGGDEGSPREEAFMSDAALLAKIQQVPELKHFYGKMQSAYGKSREELKRGREASNQVQQFYSDPAYRRQVISQFQHEMAQSQPQAQRQSQGPVTAPAELMETIKAQLAPELQWMAPMLANSQWAGMQSQLAPIAQRQEMRERQNYDHSFDSAMSELSQKHPGWEGTENEMTAVYGWLSNGPLSHPKYGNRLEALYTLTQMLNGNNGQATAAAARRMGEAARNRTTTGRASGNPAPNYTEQVRKASTSREAFAIAAKAAEDMMSSHGGGR